MAHDKDYVMELYNQASQPIEPGKRSEKQQKVSFFKSPNNLFLQDMSFHSAAKGF